MDLSCLADSLSVLFNEKSHYQFNTIGLPMQNNLPKIWEGKVAFEKLFWSIAQVLNGGGASKQDTITKFIHPVLSLLVGTC